MRLTAKLAALAFCCSAAAALAQPPTPQSMTPPSTMRPPETGDNASNPSTYDQINRLSSNQDARGVVRDSKPRTRPATAAEILLGSLVLDKSKKQVGTIERVEADGAVVATASGKVKVPLDAFGTDGVALLIGISKADFDKLVASANAAPAG
jgi:hypothetical protein